MGNSNLTSSFNKGISFLCLWTCFFAVDLEVELEEENKEVKMEVKEEFEEDPLLIHFFPLKIHPDLDAYVPSNPHTKLSSYLTWRRKFFETLSHPKKFPLLMPSSLIEKLSFSI
jgi:hypothetical protein